MHIYVFGSVCRGEVDTSSDIDMLAIVHGLDTRFNPSDYSIYSYERILELWQEGNPFAWHLYLEAKLVYASDTNDFLRIIGKPSVYKNGYSDCKKFYDIFLSAKKSIEQSSFTETFDLSSVFLGMRNFATCFSLLANNEPNFSRNSARILGMNSVPINETVYSILEKARVLCTRGAGEMLTTAEISEAKVELRNIDLWMSEILKKIEVRCYERV
ncbi:hypothetical protein R6242_22050 [Iodobacter sp. CM08]|uniref:hypothetical protein n=1 Tax=Iodobacter sp. CM08 TaxID=3085902 RepID=UPI00298228EC|nr:hypothetical protein [Iodobacter sp. CM08]MDW5419259.1 hypothetical protein [Iodobacter sp. CM08]